MDDEFHMPFTEDGKLIVFSKEEHEEFNKRVDAKWKLLIDFIKSRDDRPDIEPLELWEWITALEALYKYLRHEFFEATKKQTIQ